MRLRDQYLLCSTSLTTVKFVYLHSSTRTFFERVGRKMFWALLGYIVAKACASPRKFDLVHQTVSPRERVESGDETICAHPSTGYKPRVLVNSCYVTGHTRDAHSTKSVDAVLPIYLGWNLELLSLIKDLIKTTFTLKGEARRGNSIRHWLMKGGLFGEWKFIPGIDAPWH